MKMAGLSGNLPFFILQAPKAEKTLKSEVYQKKGWKFRRVCFIYPVTDLFPDSSAVEQSTVNRLVAGSNPARGAISPFSARPAHV